MHVECMDFTRILQRGKILHQSGSLWSALQLVLDLSANIVAFAVYTRT
jgi:hypothetical protein